MSSDNTVITSVFNQPPSIPKKRQDALKINGWGYNNCKFVITDQNDVKFSGHQYSVIDDIVLPNFKTWMKNVMGIDTEDRVTDLPTNLKFDQSHVSNESINNDAMDEFSKAKIDMSTDVNDRIFRAHGHTLAEIYTLRKGKFPRIPDVVLWVKSHEDVVKVVDICSKHNCVIIPFGGGTNVTGSLLCPEKERRMIVSLDTSQMNKILWLDEKNLTVRIEAGIVGQDMDRRLAKLGYCVGHEPDSIEFSTLGGWVATRASGMKKNRYGNIEDLLVHVTAVTPKGVIEREYHAPRVSNGPDVQQCIMGSEGTLGVVTQVTLKVCKLPQIKKFTSIIFKDFESGFNCLREVARQKLYPSSIRLMDNEQFHFGLGLKPKATSWMKLFVDGIKKTYLLNFKGFEVNNLCIATVLIEGDSKKEVTEFEKKLLMIAANFTGISGGEENGKRGYLLTYVIAYIRDLALDHCVVAESFETSVPWDRALAMCSAVKRRVKLEAQNHGIQKNYFVTCRITQLYDAGVCVYFYLGLNYSDIKDRVDPVHVYEEVENAARDEILNQGGSLSHHHGVGLIRKKWLERVISPTGMGVLRAIKRELDPDNLFANGSLYDDTKLKANL